MRYKILRDIPGELEFQVQVSHPLYLLYVILALSEIIPDYAR